MVLLTKTIQEPISETLMNGTIYKDVKLNMNLEDSIAHKYIWSKFDEYRNHGNIPMYSIVYPNPYTGEYLSSIEYNGYAFPRDYILNVKDQYLNRYPINPYVDILKK